MADTTLQNEHDVFMDYESQMYGDFEETEFIIEEAGNEYIATQEHEVTQEGREANIQDSTQEAMQEAEQADSITMQDLQTESQRKAHEAILQEQDFQIMQTQEIESQTKEQGEKEHEKDMAITYNDSAFSFLHKKIIPLTEITELDQKAESTQQDFEREFSDLQEVFNISNKLDTELEKKDTQGNYNKKRDIYELEKEPKDIEKEQENLERALENITRTRSLADLLKALYMLDEALFALKEKTKEPKENKVMQTLIKGMKEGKENTKEYTQMALEAIKDSKEKLDSFIETRKQEKEMNKLIGKQRNAYYDCISDTQKADYAQKIQQNLAHVDNELPNFAKRYPNTYKNAKDVLVLHEKKMAQAKEKNKGMGLQRTR